MHALQIRKALNKAFLKVKPTRDEIDTFKKQLRQLLEGINPDELEEFNKNLLADFLKNTAFASDHFINTKGRNDLVIHHEKTAKSPVGVIVEAKRPENTAEMPTPKDLNAKATQELLLYYLRERITGENDKIKHLIVTDVHHWFVFDEQEFYKHFAQDKKLIQDFKEFERGAASGTKTDYFYQQIAQPAIAKAQNELAFTHFDLRDYQKIVSNPEADNEQDKKLIPLFKILSPQHLLKLPFANDSNTLDKRFYNELLHLIGLHETGKSKKVIERLPEGKRNAGSLLENTIVQLESTNRLRRLSKRSQYGKTEAEQLEAVALELVITWVNRILFLKLLEAQLLTYHQGDKSYAFLSYERLSEFDEVSALFFQVLAKLPAERTDFNQEDFAKVPYLNSSLFEPTELEEQTIFINALRDKFTLPLHSATVLKDDKGKRLTGERNTLEYLLDFLDAYDFASEGTEDIQEQQKSIINAAVLGLIFEKINGYKDGSFFTPGFITMYMCRETLRRAVVQKFNEVKGWKCQNLDELYDQIEDRNEANQIVNSLKICDPAVGSGHFLVSALNELIAIKAELRILQDTEGRRIKEYRFEVVNDELMVTDEDEETLFQYNPKSRESQRIQKMLFHEKQTLIENCLFGVDINPNSVKICRLRLWIELLKNAYYKSDNQLETLPNIDINIKTGNSLISRFGLDTDLKEVLKKNKSKWTIETYRNAVATYRTAENKEQKRQMIDFINTIKADFKKDIYQNDPKNKQLKKLLGQRMLIENKAEIGDLFEKLAETDIEQDLDKINQKIEKLEQEIEDIRNNVIYQNAFEWRFEFPEVLSDEGEFIGFDVVIGNPPYIRQEEFKDMKGYLKEHYETYAGTADLLVFFIEKGIRILREGAHFTFIISNKWMRAGYGKALRKFVQASQIQEIIDFGDLPVFEEATAYPCILSMSKSKSQPSFEAVNVDTLDFPEGMESYLAERKMNVLSQELPETGWTLTSAEVQKLLAKMRQKGTPLGEYVDGKIFRGVLTGYNKAFVIDEETKNRLIAEDPKSAEVIKPFLAGRDIKRYQQPKANKYLIFTRRGIEIGKYPAILNYLNGFKEQLMPRPKNFQGKPQDWPGRKPGSYEWYEIQDAVDYYEEFEKEKIIIPAIVKGASYAFDTESHYGNDKTSIIPTKDKNLIGLLNSKLIDFFLQNIAATRRGGYLEYKPAYVSELPLLKTNQLSALVTQILALKKSDPAADTSALESEIDTLVYQLYGLSEEEIRIVEGV